jgi:hypothetical protein
MHRKIAVSIIAAVFCGSFAVAGEFVCGTSAASDQRLRELNDFVHARAARDRAHVLASPAAELRDGTVLLNADELNSPFRRPIDLVGKTIDFTRESDGTYYSRVTDLQFDSDMGVFGTSDAGYTLTKFTFPFYDRTLTHVWISSRLAVFPDVEPGSIGNQWGELEMAVSRTAMIAPLWQDYESRFPLNALRTKETSDALTISWTTVDQYTVQAVLFRSGNIRFSYKRTDGLFLGITGITSGNESLRDQKTTVVSFADPATDVDTRVTPSLAPMLDLRTVDVRRIAGSNLLEVEIKVDGAIDRNAIPSSETLYYVVVFGTPASFQYAAVYIAKSTTTLSVPGWGSVNNSPAMRVSGSSIIFNVLEDALPTGNINVTAATRQVSINAGDTAATAVTLDPAPHSILADLRSPASSSASLLLTAYTLPIFNPYGAYDEVKSAYHLSDTDFDAVAFYQNFPTDLQLYASAYSTGGNSAVTGVALNDAKNATKPRTPSLLHMNQVAYAANSNDFDAAHTALHEFGHRWLYFIAVMENGAATHSLNPISAHPAQYVSTPAAFRVHTDKDTSEMGGGFFTENASGTFTTGPRAYFGYSWTDLYLMGLADASEVVPWYYIAHTVPSLGGAYYPPGNSTYSGTKTPVLLQQVVDAIGPRKPAYPDTQRNFRVLFVLVAAPERPATQNEVAAMANYRHLLETDFPTATGGRASVSTLFTDPGPAVPRRRAVRH